MNSAFARGALLAGVLGISCSDGSSAPPGDVSAIADLAGGTCAVEVAAPPDEGFDHTGECCPVTYKSKPPSSGTHYPIWPVFRVYEKPVPWGYLVHGLEHGAVIIAYNCPNGCDDQITAVKSLAASIPPKSGCPRAPVIVVPDPTLDVPFAATAWGYTMRAKCFDHDRFAAFIQRRENHGREFFPTDCGEIDEEATGWCPGGLKCAP